VLGYICAILWGGFAAQFLVQSVTSFLNGLIALSGLIGSKVDRVMNATGVVVGFGMGIVFAALLYAGHALFRRYVGYITWDGRSIALAVAFGFSLIYCVVQIPGKLILAWVTAWVPNFAELSRSVPAAQRVDYAWKTWSEGRLTVPRT
jgi:uncharacterized protein YebE (UPF0316 family)